MSTISPSVSLQSRLLGQLADRRSRLERTISAVGGADDLVRLLGQVDAALSQVEAGHFGHCAVCHEDVGETDLLANPMAEYCLCKLTPERQRALQEDLDLAWRVQAALLPAPDLSVAGWRTHYRYLPHGPVSGDYCDLIVAGAPGAALYFMLGDVSGKGVAASLLMAHLNASFRALVQDAPAPQELVGRANRLLADSTLETHYATLVCGAASPSGEVQIVNAGHCRPLIVRGRGDVEVLKTTGLPLGLGLVGKAESGYSVERWLLQEGDTLVLYTDGITEAVGVSGEEYGVARLSTVLARSRADAPHEMLRNCLADLTSFLNGGERGDDLTILALQRTPTPTGAPSSA